MARGVESFQSESCTCVVSAGHPPPDTTQPLSSLPSRPPCFITPLDILNADAFETLDPPIPFLLFHGIMHDWTDHRSRLYRSGRATLFAELPVVKMSQIRRLINGQNYLLRSIYPTFSLPRANSLSSVNFTLFRLNTYIVALEPTILLFFRRLVTRFSFLTLLLSHLSLVFCGVHM